MTDTNWLKQTDKPLYPDIEWSKPQSAARAGKLLIIGGNSHEVFHVQAAFQAAGQAGIGDSKAVFPDAVKNLIQQHDDLEFAPSTKSGGFAKSSSSDLLGYAKWADTVLLIGDLGRNSETSMAMEEFITQLEGRLIVARDTFDILRHSIKNILNRESTSYVLTLEQLQSLFMLIGSNTPITHSMNTSQLVELLNNYTAESPANICTYYEPWVHASSNGITVSTKVDKAEDWQIRTSSYLSVYLTHHPQKPIEAMASGIFAAFGPN